ncbi:MAG: redoxin domain-containing protein [Dehalococcoidia bacterium]
MRFPKERFRGAALGAALLLFLTACGGGEADPAPAPAPVVAPDDLSNELLPEVTLTGATGGQIGDTAPAFTAIANWINSDPLTMEGLRGKVVLIDFWTYTCVNCIRTFPFLREWQEKYAGQGLVIVGVHSPEFEFEKLTSNVAMAMEDNGLGWAVAQDNDFGTWLAYKNRFWPAKYLVDAQGVVRYTHFGEGAYDETEAQVRALLTEAGFDVSHIEAGDDPGPQSDPKAIGTSVDDRITREIYGGFERNATQTGIYIAHARYYDAPEVTQSYTDPGDHLNQFMYLQGSWFNGLDSIRHARTTESFEDYLALHFFARSVNGVFELEVGSEPYEVQLTLEDRPLRPDEAGPDVTIEGGRSFVTVDQARLYEIVSLPSYDDRELKLSSNSPEFALAAFTFGAYDGVN